MQKMIGCPHNIDQQYDEKEIQHGSKPKGARPVQYFRDQGVAEAFQDTGQNVGHKKEDKYPEVIIFDSGKKLKPLPSADKNIVIHQGVDT
jgi:hypothetical protein